MNAVNSVQPNTMFVDGEPRGGARSQSGIRDLLRDTALLVTSLTPGGQTPDATGFRARCGQVFDQFSEALERRGYPEDVRHEALVAQCGLLDEVALRHLSEQSRAGWALKPLQVERFDIHDAGERVFDRIEARLREPSANADLLEYYGAILGMGFAGRYARDGEPQLNALIVAIRDRLEKLRPLADRTFIADGAARRMSDWFYRLSPWAITGLLCVIALIVWIACGAMLDLQLAHIGPAKVVHP
ncbi:MAG TPA: DotU family type IV/VI secretion system protein [Paraburkholderia sp.]|nr:DotU family type IV/VI secretion system protein [Paraburkholderia sp.]